MKMYSSAIGFLLLVIFYTTLAETNTAGQNAQVNSAAVNDGKYHPTNDGKYHHTNKGAYVPKDDWRYVHVHDMRELGKYIHIPFPYDGGYGPYSGKNIPYEHDPTGEYSNRYQVSNKIPEICLQYVLEHNVYRPPSNYLPTPNVENSATPNDGAASTINNKFSPNYNDVNSVKFTTEHHQHQDILIPQYSDKKQNNLNENSPNECSPNVDKTPITTTSTIATTDHITNFDTKISNTESSPELTTNNQLDNRNSDNVVVIDSDDNLTNGENSNSESTTQIIINNNEQNLGNNKNIRRTTTTKRPRTRYDDEGKWRIIRQNEKKQKKTYQYSFETENGILAQEHGTVNKQKLNNKEGTNGHGFYQYIGDDGKIYRVEYTVGDQGFMPKADHLPTALKRALEYQLQRLNKQKNNTVN